MGDSIIKVAEHAGNHGKHFAMNLSAPFLAQFFKDPMLKVMAHADIVFGNETEADEFANSNGYGVSINSKVHRIETAKKIAALPLVSSGSAPRSRLVVITQGADPVIVVQNDEVAKLAADKIVDTNGAGDAFVGGFLAQLALGKSVKDCVKVGIWAATEIIQQSGCTCPTDKKYTFSEIMNIFN